MTESPVEDVHSADVAAAEVGSPASRAPPPSPSPPPSRGEMEEATSPSLFSPPSPSPGSSPPHYGPQKTMSAKSRLLGASSRSKEAGGDPSPSEGGLSCPLPSAEKGRSLDSEELIRRLEKGPLRVSKKFTFCEDAGEEEGQEKRLLSFAEDKGGEELVERTSRSFSLLGFDIPPPPDTPRLPYYEQSVCVKWASRGVDYSLQELEMDEDVDRLRVLREILSGIRKTLGPLWESRVR